MRSERKLLVVDDNFDFAETLAMSLVAQGYPAIAAASVSQALDLLDEDGSIGVVISDVRMPGVDGMDFRRVLRHRFPKMPVVLMTGAALHEDDQVPTDVTVLQKPFPIAALIAVIVRRD